MHAAPELPIEPPAPDPEGFPVRFLAWRRELERARVALAARPVLSYVSEADWLEHFAAGRAAVDALVAELERFD